MQRFKLSVGEPWDFEGPDGPNQVFVEFLGYVEAADKKYSQDRYLLLKVLNPFIFQGKAVEFMIASPRYVGDTVEEISTAGGTVGASRIKPNAKVLAGCSFNVADVEYCIIGGLHPL